MIGSLWNGISGLNSFQQALQTESNNITNVNTVGYKADKALFEDMLYKNGIGGGTSMMTVQKSFEQGSINPTGNAYDMALSGDGFFVVNNKGTEYAYTRAGNFKMGTNGTLQTSDGKDIMGLAVGAKQPSDVVTTDPAVDEFTNQYKTFIASQVISTEELTQTINAKATNYTDAVSDLETKSGNNYKLGTSKVADVAEIMKDYRSALSDYASNPTIGTSASNQKSSVTYDLSELTEGDIISMEVGDEIHKVLFENDAQTTLKKLTDKISNQVAIKAIAEMDNTGNPTGKIDIEYMTPGKEIVLNNAKIFNGPTDAIGKQFIIDTTASIKGSGLARVESIRDSLKDAIVTAGGEFLEIKSTVSHPNSLIIGNNLEPIQLKLDTVGVASNVSNLNAFGDSISVDENGSVFVGKDGNKFVVGKIKIARFNDNSGLEPIGNNLFEKTKVSGEPLDGQGSSTKIVGESLELSNSDLTSGLTNLMVYQRAFEANSKTITTSDQFLNIAIQLKK